MKREPRIGELDIISYERLLRSNDNNLHDDKDTLYHELDLLSEKNRKLKRNFMILSVTSSVFFILSIIFISCYSSECRNNHYLEVQFNELQAEKEKTEIELTSLRAQHYNLSNDFESLSDKYEETLEEYDDVQKEVIKISCSLEALEQRNLKHRADITYIQNIAKDWYYALEFYNEHCTMVTESGQKYHHYDCQYVRNKTFWMYNTELAELKGYSACSVCWDKYISDLETDYYSIMSK